MNAPHTLTANWALNYVVPIIIVGIAALAAVGLAYYFKREGQSGAALPDSATYEAAALQAEQPTPSQIKEEQPGTLSGREKGIACSAPNVTQR